ncbi:MAG: FAD-dependent monooxygenase, partial [Alphaproteobacteria bacterium]
SAYPRDYSQDNSYIAGSLVQGWEIGRFEAPSMGDERPPPQSPQKRERCPQNMFDPILQKFAAGYDSVDLRYRHRFVDLQQTEDGVTAEIDDLDADRRITITADYLVACDGASSFIRGALGIDMIGNPALTYTTNVIFRYDGFEALHDKQPGYRFIFLGPDGVWATIVAINGRDQWRMSVVRSGDRQGEMSEDDVRDAIGKVVGVAFDYEILSILPWTRRELVAERYREGRVFLAGDAAHAMSPTGGFGMNTGVGDTVDLAWKLDAVFSGWGDAALLDSYSTERRPVAVRAVTEASGNLGRMLSPGRNQHLLDDTEDGAALRQQVGDRLSQAMLREWNTLGMHLGYRYDPSPICVPDRTEAPPDDPADYIQTARPGSRAPHVWLDDGRSTLDLFGRSFVLLCLGSDAADGSALTNAATRCGMPLECVKLSEPAVKAAYGSALVLVRPDGHVAWRGDAPPANPEEIIDTVRGALTAEEAI